MYSFRAAPVSYTRLESSVISVNSQHSHRQSVESEMLRRAALKRFIRIPSVAPLIVAGKEYICECSPFRLAFTSSAGLSSFPLSFDSKHQQRCLGSMPSPDRPQIHRELPFRMPLPYDTKRRSDSNPTCNHQTIPPFIGRVTLKYICSHGRIFAEQIKIQHNHMGALPGRWVCTCNPCAITHDSVDEIEEFLAISPTGYHSRIEKPGWRGVYYDMTALYPYNKQ